MKRIGIVADDITGAQDIGIMYAKQGIKTYVSQKVDCHFPDDAKVLIIDSDSRFDSPDIAYQKVRNATKALKNHGCEKFYKKTCSVFRGNIGVEFNAMLDELKMDVGIVVAAFIKNGRVTKDGIHYVNEKKIEDSMFKNDPMNPMSISNLAEIIKIQSNRKSANIYLNDVRSGSMNLIEKINELKKQANYIIFDAASQEDLAIIAKAVENECIYMGSSGLAEELAILQRENKIINTIKNSNNKGIITIAGSITEQTKRQIERFKEVHDVISLDPMDLLDSELREIQFKKILYQAKSLINAGDTVLIHYLNDQESIKKFKALANEKGIKANEASQIISNQLAMIVKKLIEETGQTRILTAGGDTSARFIETCDIELMEVLDELQPGICSSCANTKQGELLFVLKSGSFGSDDFLIEAVQYLKEH